MVLRCRDRDNLRLGTAGILGGLRTAGRDTLRLGTAGILGGWAHQGYFAVGQRRDTQRLDAQGILCSSASRLRPKGGDNINF